MGEVYICLFILFGFSVAWMAFGETWVDSSDGKLIYSESLMEMLFVRFGRSAPRPIVK